MTIRERIENRLGFQSLFDYKDIVKAVEFAARTGFRALEINLGNPYYLDQLRRAADRRRIISACRREGIDLLAHGVDAVNFFRVDWEHARVNLAFFKTIVDSAQLAGVKHFTFHLGVDMFYGYSGGRKYTYEVYPKLFADNLRKVLLDLRRYAQGPMTLGVENVGGFRYPWVFPIVHRALGGNLRLTMDIGHINVYKGKVKEVEEDFFRDHRQFIRSSHIHDNDGKWDMHDIVGNGVIDFLPYFRMLAEQNAWCIFEVRPKESARESLKRFGRDIAPRL